ncbi:medium-chain dehydrogenase/reductase like protein [Daedalea quercina L-15889]|uniref:Medium-chain dehydrogenase/reductase like protein n=1 Tax=Daedalea quercina L-15889 TaxID=1314783 RepID=A0A165LFF8_9APHY|nr:medium-chain dehydrogenase/reductase like protein [Daedalea quercina L-15889]
MSEHKALYVPEKQAPFAVKSVPTRKPEPGQLLVKVESAGLAPVDWAIQAMGILVEKYPAVLGMDAAGTVVEVGEGVKKFKKGDRVLKESSDCDAFSGFQQYTLAFEDTTAKIPENVTFDQAATIPLALATSAIALYHDGENAIGGTCGLTPPWEEGGRGKYKGQPTVIFGGASSVGQMTIELLKLSGFGPIITTASLRNAEFLKTIGATHVLDRNLSPEDLYAQIRKITQESFKIIYDAVGTSETQNFGYELLAPGGILAAVQHDLIAPEKKVPEKKSFFMYGDVNVPQNQGALKPIPVEVVPGGLEGIPAGLGKLRKGVSCVKLVAHPQETA